MSQTRTESIRTVRRTFSFKTSIRTGDDGIAIKSGWDEYGYEYGVPSENRDCVMTPCAALAIGSEMSGGVRNVSVSDCFLHDSTAGIHIKSGAGRGGYARDILYEDLRMINCAEAIMIDTDTGGHPADDATHKLNLSALPDIRRITARRINGFEAFGSQNCKVSIVRLLSTL